nr:T9SS type A sorting domain-containing protein [Bacteroidota bacterium]
MKKNYIFKLLLMCVFSLAYTGLIYGQSNQYLHFDKVDDNAYLTEGGQYIVNKTAFSMTGWFYTDELTYGQGMMGFRDGSSGFYMIQLSNGIIECRLAGTNGLFEYVAPANTVVPQVWQHYAWVYDGSSVLLYVNGILAGSSPASGTLTNASMPFAIGLSTLPGFNFYFGGRVDEVSVWDKGLSASEVMDLKENEITGTPENLILYYKFNQGEPGGNNTTITELISETGGGTRNAELRNFAMTGNTSNFGGELNPGFQAITFSQIPNHLTIDPAFELEAEATSGLDVIFEIEEGPATIDGTTLTLTGEVGEVVVKATQPGNGTWDPADPLFNSFDVIDPYTYAPELDARNPISGDFYMPELDYIQLSALATINNEHLFFVESVEINVDGESINPQNYYNGHYIGWWMPPDWGSYDLTFTTKNNYGATATELVTINVTQDVQDMDVTAFQDIWLSSNVGSYIIDADLPSYTGAFSQVTATLELTCPTGGCGEWDRIAKVEAQAPNGQWVEIIRYITPYGIPCDHSIDLTHYMSILQGKTKFRPSCQTFDNGYVWELSLYYHEGDPMYNFGSVSKIWYEDYPFGDLANLQPVEDIEFSFPTEAQASMLKLVSTGYGWGDNNTGNAAEFHEDTHHIWVNGEETFEQHNWQNCRPNPDGCNYQNGTWTYDRAGWCPGSIAPWFDYDITEYMSSDIQLGYVFDEDYVDYCHPNNPECESGVTCPDCDDGFNPFLVVACNLCLFSDMPLWNALVTDVAEGLQTGENNILVAPNPTTGLLNVTVEGADNAEPGTIQIISLQGRLMQAIIWDGSETNIDMSSFKQGMYILKIETENSMEMRKVVLQ